MSELVKKLESCLGEQCTIRIDYPDECALIRDAADEIERLTTDNENLQYANDFCGRTIERLRAALEILLERYTGLVNSGDCGSWNCEQEDEVIAARKALKPHQE